MTLYPMIASMESLNAGSHKVVRRGTHFPDAQAAVKFLYLVAVEWTNKSNPIGKITGWKELLNAVPLVRRPYRRR